MATRLYGASRGEGDKTLIAEGVGSAVAADDVELTVDLAVSLTRSEVLLLLERIKNHIAGGDWPPA